MRLGIRLLAFSGDAGAKEWMRCEALASVAQREIEKAEQKRRDAESAIAYLSA